MNGDRTRELAEIFSRFGPAFHQWLRAGVDADGMSFARMRLMWALRSYGPQIMSELKEALGVTARNVTALVDGLEAEGYVQRTPHPEDRRATLVELTETGEETVERVHGKHLARAAGLFAHLSAEDQQRLRAIMEDLLEAMETNDPVERRSRSTGRRSA